MSRLKTAKTHIFLSVDVCYSKSASIFRQSLSANLKNGPLYILKKATDSRTIVKIRIDTAVPLLSLGEIVALDVFR